MGVNARTKGTTMLTRSLPSDESPTLYFSAVTPLPEVQPYAGDPDVLRQLGRTDRRGQVALRSGDLDTAEECFRCSLELRQRGSSAVQAGLPQAFGRLAVVSMRRGDLHRASALFDLGLEVARALRTQLNAEDAMLLQNLGYIARIRGNLDEAERCYASALSIKLLALGWSHPTVATTLCSQGMVLLRRGQASEALAKFERAREIHEAATGSLSPGLGHIHMGIGSALLRLGQYVAAEHSFAQALSVKEAIPVSRTQIARSRFLLARARWNRDRVSARELARQALREYSQSHHNRPQPLAAMRAWLATHTVSTA